MLLQLTHLGVDLVLQPTPPSCYFTFIGSDGKSTTETVYYVKTPTYATTTYTPWSGSVLQPTPSVHYLHWLRRHEHCLKNGLLREDPNPVLLQLHWLRYGSSTTTYSTGATILHWLRR